MLNKFLRSKNFNIFLSLVLATILWTYVVTAENPTVTQKFENVPVNILNAETLASRDLVVLENEDLTVNVTVEGKRFDLRKITAEDIIVTADVYGYSYGENRIPVTVDAPDNVSVVEVKSPRVTVNIDHLVSESFPVVIEADKTREDSELFTASVQPEEVMVKGAKSIVDTIAKVEGIIATGDLKTETSEVSVQLVPVDANGTVVTAVDLSAESASVEACMLPTKEVPLKVTAVGNVAGRYSVSRIDYPQKIKIKGKAEDLAQVEFIRARDVDISDVTTTSKLPIAPILTDGIYVAEESKNLSVYVLIDNVAAKEVAFDTSAISMLGLGEGLQAHVDTTEITLSLRGSENQINSATAADVLLQADLTGLGEGTHLVSLTSTYSKPFKSVEIIPAQVQITISQSGQ